MDRKGFLSAIGMGTAAFALINCVGCSKSSDVGANTSGPTGVNFTLDLSSPTNAALLTNGGFLITNGVIVARTLAGSYIAVQQSCTHQSYTLTYQGSNSRFYCPNHGATFSESGTVTNGPATRALTTYNTSLSGTSLKVNS